MSDRLVRVQNAAGEAVGFFDSHGLAEQAKREWTDFLHKANDPSDVCRVEEVEVESLEVCDVEVGEADRFDYQIFSGDYGFVGEVVGLRVLAWLERGAVVRVAKYPIDTYRRPLCSGRVDDRGGSWNGEVLYELRVSAPSAKSAL